MDDCSLFLQYLSEELDQPLAPKEKKTLDAHLAICPSCRAAKISLQTLQQTMAQMPPLSVTDDFSARVMDKIAQEEGASVTRVQVRKPMKSWPLRYLAVAACAAVCILTMTEKLPKLHNGATPRSAYSQSVAAGGENTMSFAMSEDGMVPSAFGAASQKMSGQAEDIVESQSQLGTDGVQARQTNYLALCNTLFQVQAARVLVCQTAPEGVVQWQENENTLCAVVPQDQFYLIADQIPSEMLNLYEYSATGQSVILIQAEIE